MASFAADAVPERPCGNPTGFGKRPPTPSFRALALKARAEAKRGIPFENYGQQKEGFLLASLLGMKDYEVFPQTVLPREMFGLVRKRTMSAARRGDAFNSCEVVCEGDIAPFRGVEQPRDMLRGVVAEFEH